MVKEKHTRALKGKRNEIEKDILLPSSVPDLKLDEGVVQDDGLCQKGGWDCGMVIE
jgi:hypothetical protein